VTKDDEQSQFLYVPAIHLYPADLVKYHIKIRIQQCQHLYEKQKICANQYRQEGVSIFSLEISLK
jgi:hypothetical protein